MVNKSNLQRIWRHLTTLPRDVERLFPKARRSEIAEAVRVLEGACDIELRIVVEAKLNLSQLRVPNAPQARAQTLFRTCDVWNTERNTGMLFYVLIAERAVEVVIDRGVPLNEAQRLRITETDLLLEPLAQLAGGQGIEAVCAFIETLRGLLPPRLQVDSGGPGGGGDAGAREVVVVNELSDAAQFIS